MKDFQRFFITTIRSFIHKTVIKIPSERGTYNEHYFKWKTNKLVT